MGSPQALRAVASRTLQSPRLAVFALVFPASLVARFLFRVSFCSPLYRYPGHFAGRSRGLELDPGPFGGRRIQSRRRYSGAVGFGRPPCVRGGPARKTCGLDPRPCGAFREVFRLVFWSSGGPPCVRRCRSTVAPYAAFASVDPRACGVTRHRVPADNVGPRAYLVDAGLFVFDPYVSCQILDCCHLFGCDRLQVPPAGRGVGQGHQQ